MIKAPPVSEFYARKRRLAYLFAAASFALLLAQLYLGFHSEVYSRPRAAADPEGISVVHRTYVLGDESNPDSRLLLLDPALQIRKRTSLAGDAGGILAEGDEITAYFGTRYSVLRGGDTLRGADLGQKWEVQDAVLDPARREAWIFGWNDGKIVARKRALGGYSGEIPVVSTGRIDRLAAAMDGERGPLVAWREADSSRVRIVLFDGQAFVPRGEFDLGAALQWDVILHRKRVLLISYRSEDRTFKAVTLRLQCCRDCGEPPPPERISFADPIFVLGRVVTGVAAAPQGDRLLVVLTRSNTVQAGTAPLETLLPEPGARLFPIGAEPLWRRVATALWPMFMLFFSFSLIFLGYTMFRERGRFVLERVRPPATDGPPHAEILQRVMAHILDQILLIPPLMILSDLFSTVTETATLNVEDPRFWALVAVACAANFIYHFSMEAAFGWTLGKRILGLRVTELDGSRLTLRGALVRNLLRPLEVNVTAGMIGLLFMVNSPRRQRLGDRLGRTLVVQERAPAKEAPPSSPPARKGPPGSS